MSIHTSGTDTTTADAPKAKRTRTMSKEANQQLDRARIEKRRKYLTVLASEYYEEILSELWDSEKIEDNFNWVFSCSLSIAKVMMEESQWEIEFPPMLNTGDKDEVFVRSKAAAVYAMVKAKNEGKQHNSPRREAEKMESFKQGVRWAMSKSM